MAEITESKTIEEVFQELDTLAAKLEDSETSWRILFVFIKKEWSCSNTAAAGWTQ